MDRRVGPSMPLDTRTRGQRWADAVTLFSGSWAFIGVFMSASGLWVLANAIGLVHADPYPFLFLNWLLTVISTFQSPLILLSQNRQNEVDRDRVVAMERQLNDIATMLSNIDAKCGRCPHVNCARCKLAGVGG